MTKVGVLTLFALSLPACGSGPEKSQDQSESQQEPSESQQEQSESPDLSKLPSAKSCEAFAPDVAFPDTNPNSKTFGQELSPKDFKGEVSLWIPTFDCDC